MTNRKPLTVKQMLGNSARAVRQIREQYPDVAEVENVCEWIFSCANEIRVLCLLEGRETVKRSDISMVEDGMIEDGADIPVTTIRKALICGEGWF